MHRQQLGGPPDLRATVATSRPSLSLRALREGCVEVAVVESEFPLYPSLVTVPATPRKILVVTSEPYPIPLEPDRVPDDVEPPLHRWTDLLRHHVLVLRQPDLQLLVPPPAPRMAAY